MLYRLTGLITAIVLLFLLTSPVAALNSINMTWMEQCGYANEEYIQVSTTSASSITTNSAILNGFLSSLGPYTSVAVYFEWNNGSTTQQVMSTP